MQGKTVLSSLPLQIAYSLNSYYFAFFFVAEILLFVYKGEVLPFPSSNLAVDVVLLFLLAGIEIFRIFIGSKGNLTEEALSLGASLLLLVASAALAFYLLYLQTFVLRVDVILCGILLAFLAFQLLISLIALCTFSRSSTL